ncbi:MAG: MFS transporter [Gammaproteobacteria bacterium]|nr:MFS transporter [Gammaproteobacteria bacterium]MCP5201439.1 MFS transporter [Gammaproteobacteria bacterium]
MSTELAMNAQEKRSALVLALVFFMRMLGLFMLIPVLALYAERLPGATPFLIGVAIGIYGLTQAGFQIPLGSLSDRVGRRPVIVAGLCLFAIGALIAAAAKTIWPVIVGRAVQGAGAVSGATLALAADLSRESQRTKVMAIIGISIGGAFSVAFVVGPVLNGLFGLGGLFLASGALALLAIAVLVAGLPRAPAPARGSAVPSLLETLTEPDLRVLYLGVLTLHLVLAASFVAIPVTLREGLGLDAARHYTVYLPVLAVSILLVGPLIMLSSRRGLARTLFYGSIGGLAAAELLLWLWWDSRPGIYAALTLYFVAFNFLEASLPGFISRAAPASGKGAALGAYSTFQFIGVFLGGLCGGSVAGAWGYAAVPLVCAAIGLAWLVMSLNVPATALVRPARH